MKLGTIVWITGAALAAAAFAIGLHASFSSDGISNKGEPAFALQSDNRSPGGWELKEIDDPMTDVHSLAATKIVQGERLLVDTAIRCGDLSHLTYEFATFDKERRGVEMTSMPDANSLKMMGRRALPTGPFIRFQARMDDEPAKRGFAAGPDYANVLVVDSETAGVNSADLAVAERLLIRLPTRGGEETIEVDQNDDSILAVLRACNGGREPPGTGELDDGQDLSNDTSS